MPLKSKSAPTALRAAMPNTAAVPISASPTSVIPTCLLRPSAGLTATTLKVLNLVGYYTFNHRRFSYPAAFNQSYIQRRSAGSWLLGISYQGGSIKTNDELTQRAPDAPVTTIKFGHVGIGGGYGYNLVLGRKWLLHASILPTVVVYNRNKMIVNGEEKEAQHIRVNMIFNERLAVVYNFSPRFFAGANLVMNNSVFDDKNVTVNQNKWRARVFLGMRF